MKRRFLSKARLPLLTAALLTAPFISRADLVGFDGFDYRAPSMNGQEGGAFWGYQNTAPAGHKAGMSDWDDAPGFGGAISVSSGGLLYTAGSGIVREYSGPTLTEETKGAVNTVNVAKKVYYRITLTRGSGADWCGVSSFDFGAERLFFGLFPDGTGKFSIYNQTTFTRLALSTVDATLGQTFTLVAKLDFAAGVVSLYADPDLTQSEAANTPIATAPYTATNWSTAVRLGSGGTGLVAWDNLAVATTWESLRTYEVTHLNDAGAGSLRLMMSLARTTGGRVTFAPTLRSIYAVTGTGRLLRFKRETPGVIELDVPITGLQPDESVVAIDFRPATGELYALGNIPSLKVPVPTPQTRLYRLNPATGAVTMVGSGPFSTTLGIYGGMGFDFDPRLDLIRVTNENGDNVLVHPGTGVLTSVQLPLAFAHGGTDAVGGNVRVLQTAYSGNFPGTTSPILYGFHNYNTGFIRIGGNGPAPDPGNGQVDLLFPVTEGLWSTTGFDIGDDGTALVSGTPADSNSLNYRSTLYQIDPDSGKITSLGLIGNGIASITGIAAGPSRITLTNGIINLSGGNAFVVDGPATAPGITLAADNGFGILESTTVPAVAFRNLTFTGGRGGQGGAIDIGGPAALETLGLLSLERCTFRGNHASSRGGAISLSNANARLTRCTLSGNSSGFGGSSAIYQQSGATFGAETWGTVWIDHCTVTENHTSSDSAGRPTQALNLPGAKIVMRNSLVAANTNAGNLPSDVRLPGDITQPPLVERTLLGDGTGTGIVDGTNGNRIGTTANPVRAHLTPLADNGGPNHTAPPYPGSPAIGLAAGSLANSDQRGFLFANVPDAGAAEFQGKADLARWWSTDWDGDGVPFGIEFPLSGNPRQPGPPPESIRLNSMGEPEIFTIFQPLAAPWTHWTLSRSPTLRDSWETLFTYHGPTDSSTTVPGIGVEVQTTLSVNWKITDQLPNPPRNFYRFTTQLVP